MKQANPRQEYAGRDVHGCYTNAPAAVALAIVHESADKTWNKFAVIFPDRSHRQTEWHPTREAADRVAGTFNGAFL